jgi:hypothetical protein
VEATGNSCGDGYQMLMVVVRFSSNGLIQLYHILLGSLLGVCVSFWRTLWYWMPQSVHFLRLLFSTEHMQRKCGMHGVIAKT